MITGFRVARGGAQELYGVEPDLTVLGKVLGGGLPAAAFGGPRETMEAVAPAGDVYQAGTLSGNPLAVAAGLATLRRLDAAAYERLGELTDRLAAGFGALAADRPLQVAAVPGLVTLFFSAAPVGDFAAAAACDLEAHAAFCRAMLDRGVYPPPSQFEAWFVSLAHDEETIDRTLEAAAEALADVPSDEQRQEQPNGREALRLLGEQLAAERTPISPHVVEPGRRRRGLRARAVLDAVREGYLLHYGEPRLLAGHDDDLAVLAGDYLYALGIERLAASGDCAAVLALAELIGACAAAPRRGPRGRGPGLWHAAVVGHRRTRPRPSQ